MYYEFLDANGYDTLVDLTPNWDGGLSVYQDLTPYDGDATFSFIGEIY